MRGIRMFLPLGILLWSLASVPPTLAETSGATAGVKQILDRAMDIQTRPDLAGEVNRKERARLIQKLIADNFLSDQMARDSLAGHWGRLSPGQRSEFQSLFVVLFQDSYTRMVLNFLQQENIEYRGESASGKGKLVKTVIMRSNEHIPVDYHAMQNGSRWMIQDVEIDGVSIVDNYRKTFDRSIRSGSVDNLLQRMRVQKQAL